MFPDRKISILMPCYNAEPYIKDALYCIDKQDFKNWECIIVDDCSEDKTIEIIESFARNDTRFKFFRNEENIGPTETLNRALSKAEGPYIARLDADDLCVPWRLSVQLQFLEKNTDIGILASGAHIIDERSRKIGKRGYKDMIRGNVVNTRLRDFSCFCPHSSWLARRETYSKLGGYQQPRAQDYDFLMRAVRSNIEIAILPDPLISYRIHTMRSTATKKRGSLPVYALALHCQDALTAENAYIDFDLCLEAAEHCFDTIGGHESTRIRNALIQSRLEIMEHPLSSLQNIVSCAIDAPRSTLRALFYRRFMMHCAMMTRKNLVSQISSVNQEEKGSFKCH